MAKYFEPKGDLANAFRVLEAPDAATTPELRRAIAQVHGAAHLSPAELASRFDGSSRVGVHPETGRLMLLEKSSVHSAPESWVAIAAMAAEQAQRTNQAIVTNPKLQSWQAPGRALRTPNGVSSALRNAETPIQKAAIMIGEPLVRRASLATSDHVKRGRDPYASYEHVAETLQVAGVQRKLHQEGFREDFAVDKRDYAYEIYGTEDSTVLRRTQLIGSFARELTLRAEQRRMRIATSQSVLMTQQTVYGVDPEWRDLLFVADDLDTGEFVSLEGDAAHEVDAFIGTQDPTVTPLASSMHATQHWRVISTQPF